MKKFVKKMLYVGVPVPFFLKPVIRGFYWLGVGVAEILIFLRKIIWVEPVLKSLCEKTGRGLRAECLPYIRGRGRMVLGDNVYLSGRSCFYFSSSLEDKPEIIVGNNVFIGNRCTLSAAKSIRVGNDVLISSNVRIQDKDDHPLGPERRKNREPVLPKEVVPVVIEDNAWIGSSAIILKGVTIGKNSVIGAGSVVTKDVPADSVAVGNPAKVVRELRRD